MRLSTGLLTDLAEDGLGHLGPRLERRRPGWPACARPRSSADDRRGRVELGAPRLDACRRAGRPRRRPRRSGARPCRGGPSAVAISSSTRRRRSVRRNSSTRRRWRSSVIVSPTTLPAASRARSATSARTSAIARVFSASISRGRPDAQALELLAGRGDIRVARLLGDLLGAGQDLVRLAAGLAERGDALRLRVLAIAARLFGVLETLLDPILAVGQHLRHRLERERPDDDEEQDEVERADDHPEQVDLEQRRAALGGELRRRGGPPRWRRPGCPRWTRPAG